MHSHVFGIICLILVLYGCSERSPRLALADDLPISAPHYADNRSETIQLSKVESDSWKAKAAASVHGSPLQHRVKTPANSVSDIETGTISYATGVPRRLKTS
jgi:hypothetical protein